MRRTNEEGKNASETRPTLLQVWSPYIRGSTAQSNIKFADRRNCELWKGRSGNWLKVNNFRVLFLLPPPPLSFFFPQSVLVFPTRSLFLSFMIVVVLHCFLQRLYMVLTVINGANIHRGCRYIDITNRLAHPAWTHLLSEGVNFKRERTVQLFEWLGCGIPATDCSNIYAPRRLVWVCVSCTLANFGCLPMYGLSLQTYIHTYIRGNNRLDSSNHHVIIWQNRPMN